jgi:hypothetical protein
MTGATEAQEWHRVIRASVRECLETYQLQAQAGPVTVQGLEAILARASVPILTQIEDKPPELVAALVPSLVRVMLAAFVETMAEPWVTRDDAPCSLPSGRPWRSAAASRSPS